MTEHIVSLLILERSRLQAAIDALGGEQSNVPEWVVGKSAERTPAQKSHSERMKENWAKRKAAAVAVTPLAPKKRTMSAEGRQRIIDATKARWAKINAAKAKAVTPKKKTKSAIIAEAVAPAADTEFKSKMSIAMAKSWAKRKKEAKKKA